MPMSQFPVAEIVMIFAITGITALVIFGVIFARFVESRYKAQDKLKAIEKGISLENLEPLGHAIHKKSPYEKMAKTRKRGILLIMVGLGLMVLFLFISIFEREPMVFIPGILFGLIPMLVGIGLLIDAGQRRQDLENSALPFHLTQSVVPGTTEGQHVGRTPAGPTTEEPPGESGSDKAADDHTLRETGHTDPVAPSQTSPSEPAP